MSVEWLFSRTTPACARGVSSTLGSRSSMQLNSSMRAGGGAPAGLFVAPPARSLATTT